MAVEKGGEGLAEEEGEPVGDLLVNAEGVEDSVGGASDREGLVEVVVVRDGKDVGEFMPPGEALPPPPPPNCCVEGEDVGDVEGVGVNRGMVWEIEGELVPLPPPPPPPPRDVGETVGVGLVLVDAVGVMVVQGDAEDVRLVMGDLEVDTESVGEAVVEGDKVEDGVRLEVGVTLPGEGDVVRLAPKGGL